MNMTIACALGWGVAFIGISLLGVAHPLWEKHFRYRADTGGRRSFEAIVVRKADI